MTHDSRLIAIGVRHGGSSVGLMRIVLIGAGGVGNALARMLARRDFIEHVTITDYSLERADAAVAWILERHPESATKFSAAQVDASQPLSVTGVAKTANAEVVVNAVEPS